MTDSSEGSEEAANGREVLAGALRSLISATVEAGATSKMFSRLAIQVEALTSQLLEHVPGPNDLPIARRSDHPDISINAEAFADRNPYDMIIGRFNPIAPPIAIRIDSPKAIGHVTFTTPFEGAQGWVHGAAIAAAFDMVLTVANVIAGAAGPTVSLVFSFKKPTLIREPVVFEAWVDRTEGRRTFTHGRLIQNGLVRVEAEGEFAVVRRSGVSRVRES